MRLMLSPAAAFLLYIYEDSKVRATDGWVKKNKQNVSGVFGLF
jgi:hypothetical protein